MSPDQIESPDQLDGLAMRPLVDERPVRQRTDAQGWLQRALILFACLWLAVGVLLPLFEVLKRATHQEIPVSIEEPTEQEKTKDAFRGRIGVAGYTVLLLEEAGTPALYLNNQPVDVRDGRVLSSGDLCLRLEKGHLQAVTVHSAPIAGGARERQAIRPLVVARDARGAWTVDGRRLPLGERVRVVRRFIGLANFRSYFSSRGLSQTLWNSFAVGVVTTVIAVVLAFLYAYGLTRTCMRGKLFFRICAMLPLFAPTMLYGLSLVYLFGNQGVVTTGAFGKFPGLALNIGLYGFTGIVLAETAFTFPPAMMILSVALSHTDARLYEAARALGAGPIRTFFTVTLPSVKYGLLSAVFVCFTLSFTDFGAPKIVGGRFNVLAVDIYKQVVGQQNFGMGATVSLILLAPTLLAFVADRLVQRRSHAALTARSVPLAVTPSFGRDLGYTLICGLTAAAILSMLFTAGIASFIKMWPYSLTRPEIYPETWTLAHYAFRGVGGGGYRAFSTSLGMSACTAIAGTVITFVGAWVIEKTKGAERLRKAAYLLSIVPLALPGLVIGIAYVFFFNKPSLSLPFTSLHVANPFASLYGTLALLVLSNIIHFYTVSFLTATTALRQLDKEFEVVSESMAVPFYRTFIRVTVPICFPAIIEIAAYYFVSSMATVSAVIFLYTSRMPLASVAVVNMDDAGDTAAAAAMCMLIVGVNILVRAATEGVCWMFARRTQTWRKP
jgi:iron(III) transport system permease protein